MTDQYTKVALTVIAVSLVLITAKLYLPPANRIGPNIGGPTRADLMALRNIKNQEQRQAAVRALKMEVPLTWVDGGDVDVSGSVSIE